MGAREQPGRDSSEGEPPDLTSMMMMMSHLAAVSALYCGRFQYGELETWCAQV